MFGAFLGRLAMPLQGKGRRAISAILLLAGLLVAAYVAWQKWGGLVTQRPGLMLAAENIQVTPPPSWILTDVKSEVFRDGSLSKLSVLDHEVTAKVARAFALHTWVANVVRVSKHHPARITVHLEYRRPVAMVEVLDRGERGLFPVDAQGILLPTEDFLHDPQQARGYLRISAGQTMPAGPVGTLWGDQRVTGAAQLATVIGSAWKSLGLYRIVVATDAANEPRSATPIYELQTSGGARIIWGSAPGKEINGEPSAPEKIVRLATFVQQNGPLDRAGPTRNIDLRNPAKLLAAPRTATRRGNDP